MRNTNFERHFSFVTYLIIKELPKNMRTMRTILKMGMQIIDVCCLYTHDTYSKKSCTNKRTHSLQLYKKAA